MLMKDERTDRTTWARNGAQAAWEGLQTGFTSWTAPTFV